MKRQRFTLKIVVPAILLFVVLLGSIFADWQKMSPPADVDKSTHGHNNKPSCWLATAANMLACAGYGTGGNVQQRADNLYDQLTRYFDANDSGWTDTAIDWWLSSPNNPGGNPYLVATVFGNKIPRYPWDEPDGAEFIGNELRSCHPVGLSISWPTDDDIGRGGHAITCWGDSGDANMLSADPNKVIIADSDRDSPDNCETYTYDSYTNPNPGGANEGVGWYFNYSSNHPYIKHIVTFTPIDYNLPMPFMVSKVLGSYRIHQNHQTQDANDLHYKVSSDDVDILTYRTTIDWPLPAGTYPTIYENNSPPTEITVDWDLQANPVPYCQYVTINTELVLPMWSAIEYNDVRFTYPTGEIHKPSFKWSIYNQSVTNTKEPNITGGYVVGAFDILKDNGTEGKSVVGEYRFVSEYKYTQDPEYHTFNLSTNEPYGSNYYVANFRFGHSYGMFNSSSLWRFYNWMTYKPDQQPLVYSSPIQISLDWEGRLPYPQGENYTGEYSTPDCTVFLPQDLNHDCDVDFSDFAFFADNWLMSTRL